ncbi:MAG: protease complex subunit PrcB family protein [Candidatus Blackburnbacteria bacterium]|nr:protease complex subunit PrcB family protein [Candidatus Blackburnbacteria bacterium]
MAFKTLPITLLILGILLGTITAFAAFAPNRKPEFQTNDAVSQTPTPKPNENKKIQFEEIGKGSNSKQSTRKNYVINSSKEWQKIIETQPEDPEVRVDFSKETVIAVFQGKKNTGGYGIEVSEVWQKDGNLEVSVTETSPGANCFTVQMLTAPYHIVKIPKFTEEVEFKVEKNITICQ